MPDKNCITQFQAALINRPHLSIQFSKIVSGIDAHGFHGHLCQWGDKLDDLTRDLLTDPSCQRLSLETIMEMISFLNEKVTCRIIQHAILCLETSGNSPPCPFCWINMGSDARREQVVRTDQDNALIYADPPPSKEVETDRYFSSLAELIVADLDQFGFRRCIGNVMATNIVWRRSLGNWLKALDRWVGSTEAKAIRQLTILLDFRAIYGDKRLAQVVQARVFDLFHKNPSVSHFLARDDKLFASPTTIFGRIRTRKVKKNGTCFNLKTRGLVHLINGARILALNNRIQVPSTLNRFQLLEEEQVLSSNEYHQYAAAFKLLVRLKFENHLLRQDGKDLPINCIDVSTLNRADYKNLMDSLNAVTLLQKRIHNTYNQTWMNFFN
jgi:signal-transduction protein with cAMP-binding, CBS, and nucleotidyltransferase domain